MPFPRLSTLLLATIGAVAVACSSNSSVHKLSEHQYARKADAREVKLFLTDVDTPYERLAHVESFRAKTTTKATKQEQLQAIRQAAADLGADAVIDIRLLTERHRGWQVDDRVPFRAYEQGRWQLNFLRGIAVRYETEGEGADEETSGTLANADAIPDPPAEATEATESAE